MTQKVTFNGKLKLEVEEELFSSKISYIELETVIVKQLMYTNMYMHFIDQTYT